MKDSEIRAIVLRNFYEHRNELRREWRTSDFDLDIRFVELHRICRDLAELDYITWAVFQNNEEQFGQGEITAAGVDIVEENVNPSIAITLDQRRTISVTGSNNIVGDNNSLNVDEVNAAISRSEYSPAEKAEAKSLWQKVSENKLLNTVLGSVAEVATKHALEAAKH